VVVSVGGGGGGGGRAPLDNTQKNCSIQISSYSRANVRIIYDKTKGQIPLRPSLGEQSIQTKDVY